MATCNLTIGVNIYNVQTYLRECLDSVVAQEGDDIEIILVDDGSTDNSGRICDEYAAKDSRIRVIHQKNVGLGLARNVIIDEARGEWLTFVDGDDKLTENAVKIIRKYFKSNHDIIDFAEKNQLKSHPTTYLRPLVVTDVANLRANLHTTYRIFHPNTSWGKLFRVDFLRKHNLRLPDVRKSQDFIFTIKYLFYAKSVLLIPDCIYEWCVRDSGVSFAYNPNIVGTIDKVMQCLGDLIKEHQSSDHPDLATAYYREGLIQIKNLLYLIPYHIDCQWDSKKKTSYIFSILNNPWVQDCIQHDEYLLESVNGNIKFFCDKGKIGDARAIHKYYQATLWRRRYWNFMYNLRKNKQMSQLIDFLKKILRR